jgi:hypothetical protein
VILEKSRKNPVEFGVTMKEKYQLEVKNADLKEI